MYIYYSHVIGIHTTFSIKALFFQVCYMHNYVTESGAVLFDYGCGSPQVGSHFCKVINLVPLVTLSRPFPLERE